MGARSALHVPMLRNDKLIGSLGVTRRRVGAFTENEIELVTDFAAQTAIALEITHRERELRELQMELAHTNRVVTMGQLSASITHEVEQPIAAAQQRHCISWTAILQICRRLEKRSPLLLVPRIEPMPLSAECARSCRRHHRGRSAWTLSPSALPLVTASGAGDATTNAGGGGGVILQMLIIGLQGRLTPFRLAW